MLMSIIAWILLIAFVGAVIVIAIARMITGRRATV
jgi:uncharacterized membrane protein YeaQ/YmgE (transglycosylase-associated protein family)